MTTSHNDSHTSNEKATNYQQLSDPQERLDAYLKHCMEVYWDKVDNDQDPLPFSWHEEPPLEDDIEF